MAISAIPMVADESPVETVSAAENDGYVRIGWLSTVVNWNPLAIEMVEDYVVCYLIHSSLWTYDQDWNGPVNDLATGYSFDVHPNGSMTTTINITDTAYFRNAANIDDKSHPLTADDVAFSLNLMKANEGGAFDWYLQEVSDIQVVSEYTISLWTPYQKATLIDDLTLLPIVPRYVWEGIKNPLANMNPEELVGSGPFVYETMLKDSWYRFKRAPTDSYHGAADYPGVRDVDEGINGILYTVYSDMPGLATAMNAGVEDTVVVTGSVPTFVDSIGGSSASVNIIKAAVQENGITDIAFNAIPEIFRTQTYCTGNPLLLDPIVRKAIMMTLDKDFINETLLKGLGTLGDSVVDPGFWHKDIDNELPFDPAAASAMLDTNGWNMGPNDYYVATDQAYGVQMDFFEVGTELSGIRCQAPDTDPTYGFAAQDWQGKAKLAGIGLVSTVESEITMINQAWYKADYDIWIWHWGWGPEPLGGALSCWLTETMVAGGDNCQMPMGEWWVHSGNYSTSPYINASMIEEFDMTNDSFYGFSSFDQNFSLAMHTLDVDDRKVIVDRLQQMVYESYTENPPYYDLGLYAYTDYRFDNWGDWRTHNGLNICSDLLWVWFQLEPVTNRAPKFIVSPDDVYTAYVDETEDFAVAVSDEEGDALWVNYSYGDGTEPDQYFLDGDTTAVTYVNSSHIYTVAAVGAESLVLSVSLTDMFEGRIYYKNATVEVQGEYDEPPQFISGGVTYDVDPPAYIDTPVTWSVSAKDPDGGTQGTDLKFTWDWGDYTYSVDTKTDIEDGVAVTSTQTHTWTTPNTYTVKVSVYDNVGLETSEHNVSVTVDYEVIVNQPPADPIIQTIYGVPGDDTVCVARSSDADIEELTFTWEWDDGTFTVDPLTPTLAGETLTSEVTHVWDVAGTYPVTVWVDDGMPGHNVSASIDAVISTDNSPPSAFILVATPSPVLVDVETTFNASAWDANGDALIMTVDFGDGNLSSAVTAGGVTTRQYVEFVHTYELADTYNVTVYAEDADYNESASFDIVVSEPTGNAAPEIQFPTSFSALYNVPRDYAPLLVTDDDGDALSVWYDWGDETAMTPGGDPADDYAATHTYTDIGTFALALHVDDGNGHNVTKNATVSVYEANEGPAVETIAFAPVQAEYEIGQSISFVVTVSDLEGDNVTVVIEFGDGTTDEETVDLEAKTDRDVTFTHAYDAAGDYVVNATADDGMDHSDPTLTRVSKELTVAPEGGISLVLVAGIAILLIALVVAAMLLMKRKKGKGTPEALHGMEGMASAEEPPPPHA
jgi:ABC-type transport system substrate-binding protein